MVVPWRSSSARSSTRSSRFGALASARQILPVGMPRDASSRSNTERSSTGRSLRVSSGTRAMANSPSALFTPTLTICRCACREKPRRCVRGLCPFAHLCPLPGLGCRAYKCVMEPELLDHHFHPQRSVRLDTLIRLRWLAIIGQTGAVLVVHFGLEFDLPLWACLAVIALSAWLNIALRVRYGLNHRLEPDRAAWLLAFDIAVLAVLLFLTGGLQNPFSFLFLAPVLISATALPPR